MIGLGLYHSFVRSFATAVPMLDVAGAAMVAQAAAANTLVQSMVPDALRGCIMSMFTLVLMGAMPLGNLPIGALTGLIGTMAAVATLGMAHRTFLSHLN